MVDKTSSNENKEYEIDKSIGNFGYRREGDGIVVYMYAGKEDSNAIEQLIEHVYTEYVEDDEGDIALDEDGRKILDFAEYDPTILDTDMAGELEDELTCKEIAEKIKGGDSIIAKFESFIREEILQKRVSLIFIDSDKKIIFEIDEKNLGDVLKKYKENLSIDIREYDHPYVTV